MHRDDCPKCGADWRLGKVADILRENHPEKTDECIAKMSDSYGGGDKYFYRVIGVEVRDAYDGVLYWKCPDCDHKMQRFPEGSRQARIAAQHGAHEDSDL